MKSSLQLPDISSVCKTEQSIKKSCLKVCKILFQYLEQIETTIASCEEFYLNPLNVIALKLFFKLRRHYYTYILLEIHSDEIGSQFLIEQLYETAITLTYLVEEGSEITISEYMNASVSQALFLLNEIEFQRAKYPYDQELLHLKRKLEFFITQQKEASTTSVTCSKAFSFEEFLQSELKSKTDERASFLGLTNLFNPARKLRLDIKPGSWLDLQINYFNFDYPNFSSDDRINFKRIRDTTQLSLHATKAFLEEVVAEQPNLISTKIELFYEDLGIFFEWFHEVYKVYNTHCNLQKLITNQ